MRPPAIHVTKGALVSIWVSKEMGMAQNQSGGVTQVLVHVSTYQGSILVPILDPHPNVGLSVVFRGTLFLQGHLQSLARAHAGTPQVSTCIGHRTRVYTDWSNVARVQLKITPREFAELHNGSEGSRGKGVLLLIQSLRPAKQTPLQKSGRAKQLSFIT